MSLRSTLYTFGLAGTILLLGFLIRPVIDRPNLAQISQNVEVSSSYLVDESILAQLYQAIFYRPLDEEAKTHIGKPLSSVLSDIINSQEHVVYSGLINSVKSLEEARRSTQDLKISDESKYKNLIDSALSVISVWSEALPKKASGSFIIGPERARSAIQKAYENIQPKAQREAQFGLFQALNKIGTPASISLPDVSTIFSPVVPTVPDVSTATTTPTITASTPTTTAPSITASPSYSPTPTTTPTPTPTPASFPCSPTSAPGGGIKIGIYMIDGRTSTIYGRSDCIADSAQQIQWVTCVEALSESWFYPKRDNFSYSYTVTNPSGTIIDSGNWTPNWIDSMSSCPSNNGSGNSYTQNYNLTGLTSGTPYTFTVSGTNASGSFSATAVFRTQ